MFRNPTNLGSGEKGGSFHEHISNFPDLFDKKWKNREKVKHLAGGKGFSASLLNAIE